MQPSGVRGDHSYPVSPFVLVRSAGWLAHENIRRRADGWYRRILEDDETREVAGARRLFCCTGGERLSTTAGIFSSPGTRISETGMDCRCGQSGQHCIFGKVLQISFAASVVQREFGSVMQAAFSLPMSETAAYLLKMGHEEPVPHSPIRETGEHVHSQIWPVSPPADSCSRAGGKI
ncbi:hypothetical protein NA56DRAFT_704657 [Hyaloscypha hepaticicola]|uniref:Uncharacterized protein n=1 Tax=Hyaloscypha hepaticicola TaxID=2082293 RepID=A0A2J6Q2A1_9HELO|nr:hypothetical protein NA56DRAFT_704657 [Hyaloscypha hepaticicola]